MIQAMPAVGYNPLRYIPGSGDGDRPAPNFLAALSAEESQRLGAAATTLRFLAGQAVFRQGEVHDGFFVIVSGEVRSFYTGPNGREITLAYWAPGSLVGGPDIFKGGRHMWSGEAVQATEVLHIHGRELRLLLRDIPNLAIALVEALEHKGRCYSEMIHRLGTRSAAERLAQVLVQMADRDGRRADDGIVVSRASCQDDLATMVGASRQWVAAMLERLCAQGMIDVRRSEIIVRDDRSLRRFAECGETMPVPVFAAP